MSAFAQNDKTEFTNHKAVKDYDNSIKLFNGNYYIRNTQHENWLFTQIGAAYERRVFRNFFIGTGYSEWNTLFLRAQWETRNTNTRTILYEENSLEVAGGKYQPILDGIEERHRYRMADIYAYYRFQVGKSPHYFQSGIGASYNWGFDRYLLSYAQVNQTDVVAYYYDKKANYLGLIQSLTYNYQFFRNRFSAGLGYTARYYPARIKMQHDYNLHIGVNF
jgi:hypothetical protein